MRSVHLEMSYDVYYVQYIYYQKQQCRNVFFPGLSVAASLAEPEAGVCLRSRPSHPCHSQNIASELNSQLVPEIST